MTARRRPPPITDRQVAVLAALLRTVTVKAAARELGIAPTTVKAALAAIRRRLCVESTEQAIAVGVRDGWLAVRDL